MRLGEHANFISLYLESCIWPDAILQWIQKRTVTVHQSFCKLRKSATDDESRIDGYDPETEQQPSQRKIPNLTGAKKVRQVKSKVKSMLMIFFASRVFFTKNSSW
jgi:hypothetical protein